MTVRVTRAYLEVLTTPGTPLNGFADGTYDLDWTTYRGHADSTYVLPTVLALTGWADAQYSIPEIKRSQGYTDSMHAIEGLSVFTAELPSRYVLDARTGFSGYADSEYVLNLALAAANGWTDATQALNALVELNGYADSSAVLTAAFQAMNATFISVYELPNVVARTGYTTAEYVFNAYVPQTGYADGTAALLTFLQLDTYFGSEYALEALQALETKRHSQYQLAAGYQAAQGYLDALYELQVRGELTGYLDSAFSLNALLQAQSFRQSSYLLNKALAAVNGFTEVPYVLNAYLPANGFLDGQFDLNVFVALTGYADSEYGLQQLLALTGHTDSNYFLDVTEAVYTWVINQNTGAPARYEDHDFHSFGRIGRSYLGAKADGIYLLEGDDDGGTPIDAIASTGRMDFGTSNIKRVLAAYLGVDGAGQVNITLRTDADHSYGPYQFRTTPTGHQVERVKFAKGIKSRYWEFDLENVDGGDLGIDEIEFDVIELSHRLKR